MPKPFATEAGNGLHVNQSLLDSDGRNAFAVVETSLPSGRF